MQKYYSHITVSLPRKVAEELVNPKLLDIIADSFSDGAEHAMVLAMNTQLILSKALDFTAAQEFRITEMLNNPKYMGD